MQSSALASLKRFGWNRRALELDDFYEFTARQNILVMERDYAFVGRFDYLRDGQPRIRLSTLPTTLDRTHAAWHEIGHWALHHPGHYGYHAKTELEADCVADCALVPLPLLRKLFREGWDSQCRYPHWLINRRWYWWRLWRL